MICPVCKKEDFIPAMGMLHHKNETCNYSIVTHDTEMDFSPVFIDWNKLIHISITGNTVYKTKKYQLDMSWFPEYEIDQESLNKLISLVDSFIENFKIIG